MYKILFVCHGNICRSPMAEFVFKDLVKKAHLEAQFEIYSAATSREEIGNDIHPGTRLILEREKIDFSRRAAVQMTKGDYDYFDLLLGMDKENIRNMNRICQEDPKGKIKLFSQFGNLNRDIADPWYTGNFEKTFSDILVSSQGLLRFLLQKKE